MSRLHHPNIVQFYGVHYESGSDIPILIMEYLPMSLTKYLEQNEIIPNHIKNSILLDVSHGLLYLHTQTPPIIHRDLTANNVLLTSNMKAKITDFGVSCMFEPEFAKHYMRMSTCPGNQLYMPPEALKSDYKETSDNFDKLDVFSFGVLILHVYTQQWPTPTGTFDEHNMPRTEVQRRQHLLDQVENDTMRLLAMECLCNQPQYRPHTSDLKRRIDNQQPYDDDQQPYDDDQQLYDDDQQSFDDQKPYDDDQQPYDDDQQPYDDDQQPYDDDQQSFDDQQPYDDDQQPYDDDQQPYDDDQQPYDDDQQSFDDQQPYDDDQQLYDDDQQPYDDDQQPYDDDQQSFDDQQPYDDDQQPYDDDQQPYDDDQQSFDDQQPYDDDQQSFDDQQPYDDDQ